MIKFKFREGSETRRAPLSSLDDFNDLNYLICRLFSDEIREIEYDEELEKELLDNVLALKMSGIISVYCYILKENK